MTPPEAVFVNHDDFERSGPFNFSLRVLWGPEIILKYEQTCTNKTVLNIDCLLLWMTVLFRTISHLNFVGFLKVIPSSLICNQPSWTSDQQCWPGKCTKPGGHVAEQKAQASTFLPGCGLQNTALKNVQPSWRERWQDTAETITVQRILLCFFKLEGLGFKAKNPFGYCIGHGFSSWVLLAKDMRNIRMCCRPGERAAFLSCDFSPQKLWS